MDALAVNRSWLIAPMHDGFFWWFSEGRICSRPLAGLRQQMEVWFYWK
jgi:hypothetical protein